MNTDRLMRFKQRAVSKGWMTTPASPALWFDRMTLCVTEYENTNHFRGGNNMYPAGGNVGCRLLEGRRLDVCQEAHPPHVYPDDGDVSRRGHACRAEECAVAAYAHGDGVGRRVVGRQECRVDGQPGLVVQEAGKVRLDGVCYPAPLE